LFLLWGGFGELFPLSPTWQIGLMVLSPSPGLLQGLVTARLLTQGTQVSGCEVIWAEH